MNILIITPIYPGYYNETRRTTSYAIHYFAKEWVKKGNNVEVLRIWPYYSSPFFSCLNKRREYISQETFTKDGVKIHRLPIKKVPGLDFRYRDIKGSICLVQKEIQQLNPDIILCHSISPSFFLGRELSKTMQVPLYLTIHKTDIAYLARTHSITRFKKYQADITATFFRSFVLRKKYSALLDSDETGNVVLSGVDEREILDLAQFRQKAKKKTKNFLVACNLDKNKRVGIILKALKNVASKYQVRLQIIGDGPERANLEQFVVRNKMGAIVEFLGVCSREEVFQFMYDADVFVMVSSPETLGLVYLEAMSKGCIVIGSKGEGIDGVVQHGVNGFLCEVDNIGELSSLIEHCVKLTEKDKNELLLRIYATINRLSAEECADYYLDMLK